MNFFLRLFAKPANFLLAQVQSKPKDSDYAKTLIEGKLPESYSNSAVTIVRTAYITNYDTTAKVPLWVGYTLTQEHAEGKLPRSDAFAPDFSLPDGKRSVPSDYAKSGYDTGHMANDADMRWDKLVERESFILSNMCPQTPELNRGSWKALETAVRNEAVNSKNGVLIYCGPFLKPDCEKIGKNQVWVPYACYKITKNLDTNVVKVYVFNNDKHHMNAIFMMATDLKKYESTLALVESKTGIKFNL